MRSTWWMAGALASTMLVVGCAHQTKVSEAKLGQLPLAEKQAIFAAQHNVTVEEANAQAATRARDEATTFREVAKNEVASAKSRGDASRQAIKLAQKTGDPAAMSNAQRGAALASRELAAARAQQDYGEKLVELRNAQVTLANDRVTASRNEVAFAEADAVRRHGIDPGVNMADVTSARDKANGKVIEDGHKVAILNDEANSSRLAWEQRRRAFNLAQSGSPIMPTLPSPGAAPQIPETPVPVQPPITPPPAPKTM
jgi:hypothetical protein